MPAYAYTAVNRASTEIAGLMYTQISANVQEKLVKELPWLNGSMCVVQNFNQPGIVQQIAQEPGLTMSSTSESATAGMGDVSAAWTLTSRTLTATLYAVDVIFTKVALEASVGNIRQVIERAGQRAAIKIVDTTMCALYGEATAAHELSAVPYDYAAHCAALELLGLQNAPGPYSHVHPTARLSQLHAIPEFNHYRITGRQMVERGSTMPTGLVFSSQDTNFYVSNNIVDSGGYHAMTFDPNALGIALKEGFNVGIDATRLNVGERSLIVGFEIWFASGGLRDTSTTNAYIVDTNVGA